MALNCWPTKKIADNIFKYYKKETKQLYLEIPCVVSSGSFASSFRSTIIWHHIYYDTNNHNPSVLHCSENSVYTIRTNVAISLCLLF